MSTPLFGAADLFIPAWRLYDVSGQAYGAVFGKLLRLWHPEQPVPLRV